MRLLTVGLLIGATIVVGQQLVLMWGRYSLVRARVSSITQSRTLDFKDSLLLDYALGLEKKNAIGPHDVSTLVVLGPRVDWLPSVRELVEATARTSTRAGYSASIVLMTAESEAGSVRDHIRSWGEASTSVSVIAVADPGSFSRHTGVDVLPYTAVFMRSSLVATFDGLWPTATEIQSALGDAQSATEETMIRRGGSMERLVGTATPAMFAAGQKGDRK